MTAPVGKQDIDRIKLTLSIAVLLFCEWFFFRNIIGKSALFSNNTDGRLTMLITDHWFHVLRGERSFADLGMFYPLKGTLAYTDMFLGFGLIHAGLRTLGLDIFNAFKTTLILVHVFGALSIFYLLRVVLSTKYFWAVFGAMAFSCSCSYAFFTCHTQLIAISLIPLFLILVVRFFQNIENRKKRNAYAGFSILLIALVLYTAWYVAFFTAVCTVVTVVTAGMVLLGRGINPWEKIKYFFATLKFDVLVYILLAIITVIPFVLLEIPALKMSGGYSYQDISKTLLPDVIDVINSSSRNGMIGGFLSQFSSELRGLSAEVECGFSVVLLMSFIWSLGRIRNNSFMTLTDLLNNNKPLICYICSLSVAICCILPMRLSINGASAWWFIYQCFPGGKAIRAVPRIWLYLSCPMAVITALNADRVFQKSRTINRIWKIAGSAILICILFVSNIRIGGITAWWEMNSAKQLTEQVSAPPQDCKIFYLIPDENSGKSMVELQLDAYEIANKYGIKTINGYSGLCPAGYEGIWDIENENYEKAVADWIDSHGINDVYKYNAKTNQWLY